MAIPKMTTLAILASTCMPIPAFAQAPAPSIAVPNVTVYGRVDVGFAYTGGSGGEVQVSKATSAFGSGILAGSRFGVKASQELALGLKAVGELDSELKADTGSSANAAKFWNLDAYAGLGGDYGQLTIGRHTTEQLMLMYAVDPFEIGTCGSADNLIPYIDRVDNSIQYLAPSFGGFTVSALYSQNTNGTETATNAGDTPGGLIAARYQKDALLLGASYWYEKRRAASADDLVGPGSDWIANVGLAYDWKVFRIHGFFGTKSTKIDGQADSKSQISGLLGASVPLGKGSVRASGTYWADTSPHKAQGSNTVQLSGGYFHNLAENLTLYGVAAHLINGKAATKSINKNKLGVSGLNLGMRYNF